MNDNLRVALSFVKTVIDNNSKFVVAGSVNDLIHFKKSNVAPIEPNDLDIIICDKDIIKKLSKFVKVNGEFELPIYDNFLKHTQFFIFVFGVRVDIFMVSEHDFNNIDKEYINVDDMNIQFQSKDLCISNHKEYVDFFINYSDSAEFSRFKKHSKRLSFYTMIENNKL